MDLNKSIFENRKAQAAPFLVAHRGVCGANVPCNTMTAFKIAMDQGADVIELDVARAKDGGLFVFHPGMEHVFLRSSRPISDMESREVEEMFLVNQDSVATSYKVPTFREVLDLLKGRVYINVDKFWTDVEGISKVIREAGVAEQVIVKTSTDERSLNEVRKYAPDLMFMPLVREVDTVTEGLSGIHLIGAELLFSTESSPCIQPEYIDKMHDRGLLVWANSIIYNERDVISAHRTDDISLSDSPEKGWGWLMDRGMDFIQTDWLLALKHYIASRK
ncbi:MAG: glycerophosphodiester phosphodiesterase family protein [Clostridia bacterium]|nr:glycerophosphodiester phosphodiesterase family protein [Clostridia bacterium]